MTGGVKKKKIFTFLPDKAFLPPSLLGGQSNTADRLDVPPRESNLIVEN